jgi:archaellum component FlaC
MNQMQDKGPNDLEAIIEKLKRENYKLEMEIEMLKKDMAFLREEYQARALEKRDW